MVETFLKWIGGKSQIINTVLELFPDNYDNYYELFLGGGSVLINLLNNLEKNNLTLKSINAGDFNKDLIDIYCTIKNNPKKLNKKLEAYVHNYNEAELVKSDVKRKKIVVDNDINKNIEKGKEYLYYYYRSQYNNLKIKDNLSSNDIIKKSALFIFLNKTCFRGVYRENSNKLFNVPFGNYANPEIYNENNINKLSEAFNKYNVEFFNLDFKEWKDKIKLTKNNFVYMDPPYYPENEKSFTKYTSSDFKINDHQEIINMCEFIKNNNDLFLLSNSDTQFIKDNLKSFEVKIINCKRTINSKKPNATTNEVLIYNKKINSNNDKVNKENSKGKKIKVQAKVSK
jgi:DNA adenine methylase